MDGKLKAAHPGRKIPQQEDYKFQGGFIADTTDNVQKMLNNSRTHKYELRFNMMGEFIEIRTKEGYVEIQDLHIDTIQAHLREEFPTVGTINKTHIRDAIHALAIKNKFDPIEDYIDSISHYEPNPELLETWLIDLFGVDDNEYTRAISKLTLLGGAKRMLHPGCKFDTMLILESPQGTAKSTILEALAPYPEWFTDQVSLKFDSKKLIEHTKMSVIVEIPELKNIREAQVEHVKIFISSKIDRSRMAFGRYTLNRPRRFIMIGTTNEDHYLHDTENRRFWPVKVNKALTKEEIAHFRNEIKPVLWNEAFKLVIANPDISIELDPSLYKIAAVHQKARIEMSNPEWQPIVEILDMCWRVTTVDLNTLFYPNTEPEELNRWSPSCQAFRDRGKSLKRCGFKSTRFVHPVTKTVVAGWERKEKPDGWSWERQQQILKEFHDSAHFPSQPFDDKDAENNQKKLGIH